jgi:hypothetical protein
LNAKFFLDLVLYKQMDKPLTDATRLIDEKYISISLKKFEAVKLLKQK